MDGEGGDEAGIPGVGYGGRGGGAGGGTRCRDEGGGSSSEAVSVASSARKVSSDAVGLSNRANGLPEGSGTGRGGRGGRVRHHQAEGLGAGSTASQHRRCMRRLQEGGVRSRMRVQDQCSLVQGRHGQRKPTKTVGSSALAAVIVETTKSKLAISDSLP